MNRLRLSATAALLVLPWLILLQVNSPVCAYAAVEPTQQAVSAFDSYVSSVQSRLAAQRRSSKGFTVLPGKSSDALSRLQKGEVILEGLTPSEKSDPPGAMLHHWRATAFVPGAKAEELERLLRNFAGYPQTFAPQVLRASVMAENGDYVEARMRVRQKHILTVVMDGTYDVTFGRLDERHGYSNSLSTQITEIGSPGTASERELSPAEARGFLWRLNTYWTYEEADGGLFVQVESVSLTRSIPRGLGWVIGTFVQSIPRESLEFTLRSVGNALRGTSGVKAGAAGLATARPAGVE